LILSRCFLNGFCSRFTALCELINALPVSAVEQQREECGDEKENNKKGQDVFAFIQLDTQPLT